MYVCMYVCMYVSLYDCMLVYMCVHMYGMVCYGTGFCEERKNTHPPKSIVTTDADPLTPQLQSWMWPILTKPAEKAPILASDITAFLNNIEVGGAGGARGK